MKKIIAGISLMTLLALGVNAQDMKREGNRMHKGKYAHTAHFDHLNLNDDQKAKMKTAQADFKTKMSELKKNETITVKEMKEKRSAIVKEHQSAVDNILTADQKKQLKEMKTSRKGKRKMDSGKQMEMMKSKLNLTDEQVTQMKAKHEDFKNRSKAIRDNQSLSADAKKEQMMNLRKQHQQEMDALLTPEQVEKKKEFRQSKPGKIRTR